MDVGGRGQESGMQTQMATTGMQVQHAPREHSVIFFSRCRVQVSPTSTTPRCATRPKASTLPAPPATPALTSSLTTRHTLYRCSRHTRRPFLHLLLHPLNNHLSRRRRPFLQHRPRRHLHVTAPPNPIREVSYVCSSYALTFTSPARSEMSSLAGRGRGKIRPPRRVSHHRQPHSPRVVSTHYTFYTTFIHRAYQRKHAYCAQC